MQIKQNSCYYQVYKRRKKGDKSVQVKVILLSDVTYGHKNTFGHKKRSTAVLQPFVNLKSNTMKNTVQRYGLLGYLQIKQIKKSVL